MSDNTTLFESLDSLLKYADGDTSQAEVRSYTLNKVPDFSGEEIKEIRKQNGLTRPVLSDILGISVRTLEKWEINRSKPNGSARRLLQLLKYEKNHLIEEISHLNAV